MKKRIKQFSVFLVIGFIVFFMYSNLQHQGTWMGTYEVRSSGDFWDSQNDVILNIAPFEFHLYRPFVSDNFYSFYNFRLGNYLFPYSDGLKKKDISKIVYHDKDSLTVILDETVYQSFQKIPDSLKQVESVDLTNKLFHITFDGRDEALFFTKDLIYYKERNDTVNYWSGIMYRRVNYDRFHFLCTQYGNRIVVTKRNDQIYFNRFREKRIVQTLVIEIPTDSLSENQLQWFHKEQEGFENLNKD